MSRLQLLLAIVGLLLSLALLTEQQAPQIKAGPVSNPGPGSSSSASRNRASSCSRGDCNPETGDLLIGRTKFLHASSTCGLAAPERYCVLGETTMDATKCFVCDSNELSDLSKSPHSHTIENIVSRREGDRFNRWWQSENGKQNVYIQFDLEAEFTFTHIILTFKTFRPAAMVIEKSSNFGRTWKTYGYLAASCADAFPGISTDMPKNLGEVYCESRYSSVTPSTKGEIVFRILPPTLIQSRDPYSSEIQDLLKITNLRINFTRLHTFGDNLLDSREELKEKYYYSLYEMVVRGSCLCYGHASRCIPVEGVQYDADKTGMVDGQCQCQHNTHGTNCEKCLPLYNDRLWKAARNGQANECRPCQCHNHARSCTFNQTEYVLSGAAQSGGVCDDCLHNTVGRNCELCKEDFYRDPEYGIDHIATCKPCACDKLGSVNDAKCDPVTDPEKNWIAGRCHCKSLVEGAKCDKCKNGYFNLTRENEDGCQPCSCSLNGTLGNMGCDKVVGNCECKRFVTGRDCGQCMDGYFGLSGDNVDGCQPCNCFPGGSHDLICDKHTGQCPCKENMDGRMCDKPRDGYFCPALDFLTFEAESGKKLDQRSQDFTRTINIDRGMSWTGKGYVRVYEGAALEITVNNVHRSGNYDIVLRYEHTQVTEPWEDVRIYVSREEGPQGYGCEDFDPADDTRMTSLPNNVNQFVIAPSTCFEANREYTIKIEFGRFSSHPQGQGRDASILIDSIVLVPQLQDLTSYKFNDTDQQQRLLDELTYYGCKDALASLQKDHSNERCAKFVCNIGTLSEMAMSCDCDRTGSNSTICKTFGGECQCKPNVVGRQCDRCAPGTWGFGPNGCQPCNCNSGGAKDDFCDLQTGQCNCHDKIDTLETRNCSQCVVGTWRFPYCEACNCYGLADRCSQTTGQCIDCRDYSVGDHCERCKDGYYGDPVRGIPCKECMCPGGQFGNQFAPTCFFDASIDGVRCNCDQGYEGHKCDRCAQNFFGKPLERDGSCEPCNCNGNTDPNDPLSCNRTTGECANCLYNTAGSKCGECRVGYYGNASNHECKACNCNPSGTENNSADNCDQTTGQCNCLPNVEGKQCDMCKTDHYGLAKGEGCSYCSCDTDGTINGATACDVETGQCYCVESRGGRSCSDCKFGYWGDPNGEGCQSCDCYEPGTLEQQCNKMTGACVCRKGIKGYRCDECDSGTTGEVPNCVPCGECYDNWNGTLNSLKNDLDELEKKASNLAVGVGSSVQDFTAEYAQLEARLDDIRKILALNYTEPQLQQLNARIQNLDKQIANKKESTKKYYDIEHWNVANKTQQLAEVRRTYLELKHQAENLTEEAMDLKESHEHGAIDSINKASQMSDEASSVVATVESRLNAELKPVLEALKTKILNSEENFRASDKSLRDYYTSLEKNLTDASKGIADLNQAICGGETSANLKCSAQCGGALCDGKCGSNSSSCPGLADSYWNVLNARQKYEELYNKQELVFKRILTKLRNSSNLLHNANKDVSQLMDYANKSLQSINLKQKDLATLIQTIQNFTDINRVKPQTIQNNCEYAANKNIEQKESDLDATLNKIDELASKINAAEIEQETQASRASADELLRNTERGGASLPELSAALNRTTATVELEKNRTASVQSNLADFVASNENIERELNSSKTSIASIDKVMNEMQSVIGELRASVEQDAKDKTVSVASKQESLKSKVKESGIILSRTKSSLNNLKEKLDTLTKTFQRLIQNKENKNSGEVLENLIALQSSILNKKNAIDQKTSKIEKLQKNYEETRKRINELKATLAGLRSKALDIKTDIQSKEKYYNTCS